MGQVYSLERAADELGITPKTLKSRLGRAGISPRKDPMDRRRQLVTAAELKRLDEQPVRESDTLIRRCLRAVKSLLDWRERADKELAEYGNAIAALSTQVRELIAITMVAQRMAAALDSTQAESTQAESSRLDADRIAEVQKQVKVALTECSAIEARIGQKLQQLRIGDQAEEIRGIRQDIVNLHESQNALQKDIVELQGHILRGGRGPTSTRRVVLRRKTLRGFSRMSWGAAGQAAGRPQRPRQTSSPSK